MHDRLEIRTLGSLSVRQRGELVTGFASRKVEGLLVYLAVTRRVHSRESLAELLWPERAQGQSMANLRQALFDLRRLVAPYVAVTRQSVSISTQQAVWVDALALEEQLGAVSQPQATATDLPPDKVTALERALAHYEGDFLVGFYVRDCPAFEDWLRQERERLRQQVIAANQRLVDSYLDSGNYGAGVAQATRLLQLEPLLEEGHRRMMALLVKMGQRSAALIQYETCRRLLDEELGISPTRETTALYEEIRAGQLTTSLVPGPVLSKAAEITLASSLRNPYKGLRAFQEEDAPDFFGRDVLTERLIQRLDETGELARFLAVIGPSGSGKSSVVRAALMPALRHGSVAAVQRPLIVEMLPGAYPLEELEAALLRVAVNPPGSLLNQLREDERGLSRAVKRVLPGDSTELVLFIDQFEELFTLVRDESTRVHFLRSLHQVVSDPRSRCRLIVTLRADFMDRPLDYEEVGELIRQRHELILPMSPDDLQRAIVGPASRVGLALEPDLVAAIVREVNEQPGALPLLQYALTELFERQQGDRLALLAYRELGGVAGALARRADELYDGLDATSRAAARQLFLRLITLGEGIEDTRRRVRQAELVAIAENASVLDAVIARFSQYRLLTLDRDPLTNSPTVEVAHEALIRSWGRLRGWLDESRENLRIHRQLTAAAADWLASGRDPGFLAAGSRLARFEGLAASDLALNRDEREFLDISLAEREWQAIQEKKRQLREKTFERRARNFLRGLVAVLVVAALVGFGLSVFAIRQSQIAERNAIESQNVALVAGSQAALASGNGDMAVALALQAVTLAPTSARAQVALGLAAYTPGTVRHFVGHSDQVWGVAFSPDGRMALSGSDDKSLILWDLATGGIIRRLTGGHTNGHIKVAFSPDGRTILSGADDGVAILWDVATGSIIRRLIGHSGWLGEVRFSPDGHMALTYGDDKTLVLWDVTTGTLIRRFTGHDINVQNAVFSPDGHTILSGSEDKTVILWDVASGTMVRRANIPDGVYSVAISPDGRQAMVGTYPGNLYLWDMEAGSVLRPMKQHHNSQVFSTVFSPDGRHALTAGYDSWIGLWDIESGELVTRLDNQSAGVFYAVFSPDGRRVLSGSADKAMRLWDLEAGQILRHFEGHKAYILDVKISPDGRSAISTSKDGTAILWDISTGRPLRRLTSSPDTWVWRAAYFPDGHTALIASSLGTAATVPGDIVLWDLDTGNIIRHFSGQPAQTGALAISPNGRTFLSGARDGTVFLWDTASGQLIRHFMGEIPGRPVVSLSFSPDGQTALGGGYWGSFFLWDVQTGNVIHRSDWANGPVWTVAYRSDGRTALIAGDSGTLIWDLSAGKTIRQFNGGVIFGLQEQFTFNPVGSQPALRDVTTDTIIREYPVGNRSLVGRSAAFTPDDRSVLVGFSDGELELWRIDTLDDLIAWTYASRYVPALSCEQRQLYRLTPLCASSSALLAVPPPAAAKSS